jgi:hypothetical protein
LKPLWFGALEMCEKRAKKEMRKEMKRSLKRNV